jgi:hypothetical protein
MTAAWALALVAALVYLPSLGGAFQFDDFNVIVNEPAVHSWSAFLERATGVRPLLKASYLLNWTLGGFQLFNIAVHAVNTALVYQVGRALFPEKATHVAVIAALLFALHPVQVEAVTYVSGRSTSLMAAFYLGAVLVYLRGGHWALSGLLFVLAAATKETALTLPAALLLCDLATRGRVDWKRQLPHWGILLLCAAFVLANPRYLDLVAFGFTRRDVAENLLTQVGGVSYLVARLLGLLGPNIDPALPALHEWTVGLALQAGLLIALLAAGLLQLRRRPWLGFGILWFFLHLVPTNTVIPRLDVANDRQLYLAGWGLFLTVAAVVPRRLLIPAAALTVLLAAGSIARQLDYRSEVALWEADTRAAPWNARAWNNLGYAYQQAGRTADARRAYEAALAFDPAHIRARFNLDSLK